MLRPCPSLAALGLAALAAAQSPTTVNANEPTGFLDKTIPIGGIEHRYVVYVPPGYTKEKDWPLLVFLNGMGECGTDGRRQAEVGLGPAITKEPERWPFVVVFPQKPDKESQWLAHEALVMGTLAATEKEYRIDARRRLLTGLSQGGAGTWALGSKHADVFAAIAPVCGYGKPDAVAAGLQRMPIWAFHGLDDKVVPPQQSQDLCAAVEKAGGGPVLTLYEKTAHNSWDKAYRESPLAEWLRLVPMEPQLGRALTKPGDMLSFGLSITRSSVSAGGRVDENVELAVDDRGWRLRESGRERALVGATAVASLRECVLLLVRAGVVDDVRRPGARRGDDAPGDYVSLDCWHGIGGRSVSPWPGIWKVGEGSERVVEAVREAKRRLEQLR